MHKLLLILACAALLAGVFGGCDDKDNGEKEPDDIVGMSALTWPRALLADRDSFYVYTIRVTGMVADSVYCEIIAPDSLTPFTGFALLDDGNSISVNQPSYASPTSGDIAANNGTFTRSVNGHLLANGVTGTYRFSFLAMKNGTEVTRIGTSVRIANVQACEIVQQPTVTDFTECFSPITMEIRIARDSADHVDSVRVELLQTGASNPFRSGLDFQPFAADTVWRAVFDPTMFSCAASTPLANYQLIYSAKTRFGMFAEQTVNVASFVNHPPVLHNSLLPDTVYRPLSPTQTDTIPVTVDLNDCELTGETHFYGIRFDRARDDTSHWSYDPLYYLRDDGLAGDAAAGDGRFTIALTITRNDTLPNNMYYFRFYAVECAPPHEISAFLLDSMRVIQRISGAIGSRPVTDFGMGIVNEGILR